MHIHRWASAIVSGLTVSGPIAAAQQVKPLLIADAVATRTFAFVAPIVLSSDGEWVAYTVANPLKRRPHTDDAIEYLRTGTPRLQEGSELWIANTKTGEARDLTGPIGASWDGVWSPGGSRLAFYSDRDGLERLWVWDRATGSVRRVSAVVAHAFLGYQAPQWTPNGTALVAKILPEGDTIEGTPDSIERAPAATPNDTAATAQVYTANIGAGDTSRSRVFVTKRNTADLALVSLSDGRVQRLVRNSAIMRYWISPTGRQVAFTVPTGPGHSSETTNLYDVDIVDLSTGSVRTVAHDVSHFWGPPVAWSPDGTHLAFTSKLHDFELQDRPDRPLPPGDCYIVDAASDGARDVTPGRHADLSDEFNPPVWSADGSTLFAVGDDTVWRIDAQRGGLHAVGRVPGRTVVSIIATGAFPRPWMPNGKDDLLVRTLDERTLKVGMARLNLRTGASELAYEDDESLPRASHVAFGIDAARNVFVYTREDAAHPADIWISGPTFRDRHRLTHINPQLDAYVFGERRLIYWLSDDGDSLRGTLLLPAGYKPGTRYPLISWQYGGERWSMFANDFGALPPLADYVQLLATRGYAVLVPDAPQHIGTPMLDLAKTVLPGINRAIEIGVADARRLGIMGNSYGCASTLMIIVQTTRFKAAQCSSGPSSIIAMAGALGGDGAVWADSGQGKMGATVWERRDRYIENSPYFYLDRITTPILMTSGTSDRAVPPYMSDATYEALRQLGKRVAYVRYGGEGHEPMAYSRANVMDYLNRVVRWFDAYLDVPATAHRRSSARR